MKHLNTELLRVYSSIWTLRRTTRIYFFCEISKFYDKNSPATVHDVLFPFARDRLADFIERNPDEIENVIEFLKTAAETFHPPFKGVALDFFST